MLHVAVPKAAAPKVVSSYIQKLRTICKNATINISPNVYKLDEDAQGDALEALLAKHGLKPNSSAAQV